MIVENEKLEINNLMNDCEMKNFKMTNDTDHSDYDNYLLYSNENDQFISNLYDPENKTSPPRYVHIIIILII